MKTYIDCNGYEVRTKDKKYVHRIVAENMLGAPLPDGAEVHHKDGNRSNNKESNLIICKDHKEHMRIRAIKNIENKGGVFGEEKHCSYHKCLHKVSEFSTNNSTHDGLHNMCRNATNEYRILKGLNRDKFDWRARLNRQYRRLFKKDNSEGIVSVL